MAVRKPADDELNKLLHTSNAVTASFGQPPLYTGVNQNPAEDAPVEKRQRGKKAQVKKRDPWHANHAERDISVPEVESLKSDLTPHFHISIGWSLNEPLGSMKEKLESLVNDRLREMTVHVDTVKVKVGNTVTTISLSNKVDTFHRLLEV